MFDYTGQYVENKALENAKDLYQDKLVIFKSFWGTQRGVVKRVRYNMFGQLICMILINNTELICVREKNVVLAN